MNVVEFLNGKHISYEVVSHPNAFDAQHLAHAVGVSGRCVAKTVLLNADDYTGVVAIVPANKTVDMELASEMLGGTKLKLAKEEEVAEYCPDCEFGVLSPFGSQYGMETIMDVILVDVEEIVFEGNSHHEAIRMRTSDFRQVESPMIGHFAK